MVFVAGVDENGLGPRLGPLVATCVTVELSHYDPARVHALGQQLGIDDSKRTSGFGKMAVAESLALAVVRAQLGHGPRLAVELLCALSLDPLAVLQAPCPARSAPQCWSEPLQLPAFGGSVEVGAAMLAGLARHGVRLAHARSAVMCTSRFRDEVARRGSRFALDLALFERLLLAARDGCEEDLTAICGMVGGIRRYEAYFDLFKTRATLSHRARGSVAYAVSALGSVRFEVGADATHLPVALASMLGKYIRELAVERQNRFYARHLPSLQPASGYHDPVTTRFIADTEPVRRRLRIARSCFER